MSEAAIPIALSWSGGKDSALALWALQKQPGYQVISLLTTVAEQFGRISHHGVREELLDRQAEAVGLPLKKVRLPSETGRGCTNAVYEERMQEAMQEYRRDGVQQMAFGDIFLEDIRAYREKNLARADMQGVFPLWQRDTKALMETFFEGGFRAVVVCAEPELGESFVGRSLDAAFLRDLPPEIDPCGENGEFHSFVFDGPVFRHPIGIRLGRKVVRDGRHYIDILPVEGVSLHHGSDATRSPV